jgi:hypothetical protein
MMRGGGGGGGGGGIGSGSGSAFSQPSAAAEETTTTTTNANANERESGLATVMMQLSQETTTTSPIGTPHGTPLKPTQVGTPSGKKCNCKNSKCLKLYCECFASGKYCDNCNCQTCKNNKDFRAERQEAIEMTLERNPNAFRPKIAVVASPGVNGAGGAGSGEDVVARHNRGCHCKRSGCLKKYCECFQAGIFCFETCRCVECKNFDGSEAHEYVKQVHGPNANFHEYASVAVTPSPTRRRLAEKAKQALVGGVESLLPLRGKSPGRPPAAEAKKSPARVAAANAAGYYAARGGAVPLMHNLVQQPAVEELARILLVVADETKEGLKDGEAPKSAASKASGVAAVAELAASEHSKAADPIKDLMCDEQVHVGGADNAGPAPTASYVEQEQNLLAELERVVSRLTQNAKARVDYARKAKIVAAAQRGAAKKLKVGQAE